MVKLELTPEKVNLILKGLLELQAKLSIDLILEIDAEAKKQIETEEKEHSLN